jgi:hypothetical protein
MSSFDASFSTWLKSKAKALDNACGTAMESGLGGLSGAELEAANKSLNNLYADTSLGLALPGGDCDYSLPESARCTRAIGMENECMTVFPSWFHFGN